MILIRSLELENYRNIRHLKLEDLKDLNILVGPNNCGKTNVLEFFRSLADLRVDSNQIYACCSCRRYGNVMQYPGASLQFNSEDYYLKGDVHKVKPKFSILLDEKTIKEITGILLETQRHKLSDSDIKLRCEERTESINMEYYEYHLIATHISPFIEEGIIGEVKKSIRYCPERRLDRYYDKDHVEFLKESGLSNGQKGQWIAFLNSIVDAKITDQKDWSIIRTIEGKKVIDLLEEQGSGVRSLASLAANLLFPQYRLVLIDEPELGLNPFVKQEFLKFLLELSKEEKQIFVATHDPTFVNPVIWKEDGVKVFFYSLVDDKFVALNLLENKEDPESFAGYMPHTTTLKDIHIYVEGSSDVYIFQIFLINHLRLNYGNWSQIFNRVGIYHLGGSFWCHLLYTVPKQPYRCLVVLDGDKRKEAPDVCKKYDRKDINSSRFKFCPTIGDLKGAFSDDSHPVYCLEKTCIEEYLDPNPKCENQTYDKKVDGPRIADGMKNVPDEIKEIFDILLEGIGSRVRIDWGS